MTETKVKPSRYDMLTNIPVTVDIKYVDVYPARVVNGKTFDPQVSVKGTIDGETQTIYLKGKAWANLKALAGAGVIAGYEKQHEEPTEKVNLPVVNGRGVVLTHRQGPGERFANLVVETQGTVSRTAGVPTVPGKTASVRQAVDIGAPIPGLDDDDLPPPVDEAYADTVPVNSKLDALFKLHGVCFEQALRLAHDANAKSRVPLTLEGVSALTAQLFIASTQRGIAS